MVQGAPTSGSATASLVFGIIGALSGWCTFAIPCLLAIAFGHQGMKETKHGARGGRGMAVAGLILGYLGAIPAAVMLFGTGLGIIGDMLNGPK